MNDIFNSLLCDVIQYSSTQEWNDGHIREKEQCGITSFAFSNMNGVPSNPQRLQQLLFPDGEVFEDVLPSKGYLC